MRDDLDQSSDDRGCPILPMLCTSPRKSSNSSVTTSPLDGGSTSSNEPHTSQAIVKWSSSNLTHAPSPLYEGSCSTESHERQAIVKWRCSKRNSKRHKLHNVVGSLLGVVAIVGLSVLGGKDSHSRASWKDMPATPAGSMIARHQVPSYRTVLKSNPGLGMLVTSMLTD